MLGTDINDASVQRRASTAGQPEWVVQLDFNGKGAKEFGDVTTRPGRPAAAADRNQVRDRPRRPGRLRAADHQAPILGGTRQISGSFTQTSAPDLADQLKYGALPLTFEPQREVSTISPTLGADQLRGGLIAGAIGLVLVVLYSLLYYRGLGLVRASLAGRRGDPDLRAVVAARAGRPASACAADITGLIVSIGITADSFIVYFERIRDEIGRAGRCARPSRRPGRGPGARSWSPTP